MCVTFGTWRVLSCVSVTEYFATKPKVDLGQQSTDSPSEYIKKINKKKWHGVLFIHFYKMSWTIKLKDTQTCFILVVVVVVAWDPSPL